MAIWALADLHLAISVPEKKMDVFGQAWSGYMDKIRTHWTACVDSNDLVLLPGDISWAMRIQEAKLDLEWIHSLPGTKVMLRGNHDYWWTSLKQIEAVLPPSIHLIQNNAWKWNEFVIGGTRLWDTPEYQFKDVVEYTPNPQAKKLTDERDQTDEAEKIFARELNRLELSLREMSKKSGMKIAMTHYPPIGIDLHDSRASKLMEKYQVHTCVFGHLHNIKKGIPLFGEKNGVRYFLTSGDYLDFKPLRIF